MQELDAAHSRGIVSVIELVKSVEFLSDGKRISEETRKLLWVDIHLMGVHI